MMVQVIVRRIYSDGNCQLIVSNAWVYNCEMGMYHFGE